VAGDKDRKWSRDEMDTLHKALLRFPAGTQERWDKIAGERECVRVCASVCECVRVCARAGTQERWDEIAVASGSECVRGCARVCEGVRVCARVCTCVRVCAIEYMCVQVCASVCGVLRGSACQSKRALL